MFARIRSRCKAVTDGVTRGMAQRYGDTMGEASVETSVQHGPGRIEAITHAKLRIHEDGSGLFVLQRGKDEIAIRWTAEMDPERPEILIPLELFAKFGDIQGVLIPDEETNVRA